MMLIDNISGAIVLAFFPIERVRKPWARRGQEPWGGDRSLDLDQLPAWRAVG
jgi:hypothetical protein